MFPVRRLGTVSGCTGSSASGVSFVGITALVGFAAMRFSVLRQEPSSHQGLHGPMLPSVLRRGIAYPWGLQSPGPGKTRMLTSAPSSPIVSAVTVVENPATSSPGLAFLLATTVNPL